MYAMPSILFLVIALPMVALLWAAVLYEWKEQKQGDLEWERQRRRLESLNRPTFPPVSSRINRGNMIYAGSASGSLALSAYGWAPGAVWPVTSPQDVMEYRRETERKLLYG